MFDFERECFAGFIIS